MSSAASGSAGAVKSTTQAASDSSPLFPLSVIDAPTQRVYLVSAFILLETYKLYQVAAALYLASPSWTILGSFLLSNFFLITVASRLRVPRLNFSRAKWIVLFVLLGTVDWAACGGWRTIISLTQWVPVLGWLARLTVEMWNNAFNREMSFSEHRVRLKDLIEPKSHILGQHTIHVLPYSTASLTPSQSTSSLSNCFCLDASNSKSEVVIPILFNNTDPQYLSYSITPFDGEADPKIYNITISRGSLISVGGSSEFRKLTRQRDDQLDLELEDADDQRRQEGEESRAVVRRGSREVGLKSNTRGSQAPQSSSQRSTAPSSGLLFNLAVKEVGRVKLERVLDKNRYDARISRAEIMVVECPSMSFERQADHGKIIARGASEDTQHHCPGEEAVFDVNVRGLAPLELMYNRRLDTGTKTQQRAGEKPERETFTISHISGKSSAHNPLSFEEDRGDRLALALNTKSSPSSQQSFEWAVAQDVKLPVTVEFPRPGRYHYELDQVKDACGNTLRVDSSLSAWHREAQVHPRRYASFAGCNADSPINLLQGGPKKEVYITVNSGDPVEGPFEVQVKYQGVEEHWQRNISISGQRTVLTIDKPGTYSLEGIQGRYCAGEVGSPWLCTAQEIPPPTSAIEVDPIQDQCAGPVGVKALAILSGSPPFKLKYTIQPKGKAATTHTRTIDRTREEIEFRPTADGEITYTFLSLSDANYKEIKLDGPTFTQNLHPIAKAAFVGGQESRGPAIVLHSCEGNTASADVRLEGVGPFELSYAVRTSGGELTYTNQIKGIKENVYQLKVEVPVQVAEKGGRLTVTLTSIKDAKGCERPLTTSDLSIDVRRSKPTITFVESKETLMLEGSEVRLPIRLAGEGPWNVRYRREGEAGGGILAQFNKAEANLIVDRPGKYLLEEVSDQHCPGQVLADKSSHLVTIRPKPKAAFETDSLSQLDQTGKALTRQAVCVGAPDSVSIQLEGHFPVEISYHHQLPSKEIVKEKFTSGQNSTAIELFTGIAGQHVYELMTIADAIYSESTLPAKGSITKIVQQVIPLPDVAFAISTQGTLKNVIKPSSVCVGDNLSRQKGADSIVSKIDLTFTGKAPFTVDFEIKDDLGVTRKIITQSGITSHQFGLDIPADEFAFDKMGKWRVEVTRVEDGNGCQRFIQEKQVTLLGEDNNSKQAKIPLLEFEVVETANISAVEARSDHCVGETIQYELQGTPPWTVVYDFEGRISHAPSRTTTFARVAEKPGKLQIKRIAHQQNKCENNVEHQIGMTKTIHALPSVYVKEGKHYIEDLREGNEAEIVFKLHGVPPFSFSLQRTQSIDRFQKPVVLESYTVTDIKDTSYHLKTAEEGTWSVTWLRDRYCEIALSIG